MFRRTSLALIAVTSIFLITKTSLGQEVHAGFYFSTPNLRIIAGEPVYWPFYYPHFHPIYYAPRHSVYYRPHHNYYYYSPHKHYYRYRHDNGLHKGWYKHKKHFRH